MGDHTQTHSFHTSPFHSLSLSPALPSTHTLHYLLIIKITAIAVTCDDFWRADPIEKPARMSGRSRDRNGGGTGASVREMQELMQRLEPDKGQSAAPLARTLIASTLRLLFLWNFSCFPSFVSTSHSPPPSSLPLLPALCQPVDVYSVTNEAEVSVLYIYEKLESPSSVSKFEKGLRRRPWDWVRAAPDRTWLRNPSPCTDTEP